MRNPYEPVPIIEPREVTRVVMRVVGYRVVCLGCGGTFQARLKARKTCSQRCRKRLARVKARQALRQADELRQSEAERRLRLSRLKLGLAAYIMRTPAKGTQSSPASSSSYAVLTKAKASPSPAPVPALPALPLRRSDTRLG